MGTSSLVSVSIPNSVKLIEDFAFANSPFTCINNWDSTIVRSIGYLSLPTNSLCCSTSDATNCCASVVKFTPNVISIGPKAFQGCTLITSLIIPSTVQAIGYVTIIIIIIIKFKIIAAIIIIINIK